MPSGYIANEKSLRLYGDTYLVFCYICFAEYMKNETAELIHNIAQT